MYIVLFVILLIVIYYYFYKKEGKTEENIWENAIQNSKISSFISPSAIESLALKESFEGAGDVPPASTADEKGYGSRRINMLGGKTCSDINDESPGTFTPPPVALCSDLFPDGGSTGPKLKNDRGKEFSQEIKDAWADRWNTRGFLTGAPTPTPSWSPAAGQRCSRDDIGVTDAGDIKYYQNKVDTNPDAAASCYDDNTMWEEYTQCKDENGGMTSTVVPPCGEWELVLPPVASPAVTCVKRNRIQTPSDHVNIDMICNNEVLGCDSSSYFDKIQTRTIKNTEISELPSCCEVIGAPAAASDNYESTNIHMVTGFCRDNLSAPATDGPHELIIINTVGAPSCDGTVKDSYTPSKWDSYKFSDFSDDLGKIEQKNAAGSFESGFAGINHNIPALCADGGCKILELDNALHYQCGDLDPATWIPKNYCSDESSPPSSCITSTPETCAAYHNSIMGSENTGCAKSETQLVYPSGGSGGSVEFESHKVCKDMSDSEECKRLNKWGGDEGKKVQKHWKCVDPNNNYGELEQSSCVSFDHPASSPYEYRKKNGACILETNGECKPVFDVINCVSEDLCCDGTYWDQGKCNKCLLESGRGPFGGVKPNDTFLDWQPSPSSSPAWKADGNPHLQSWKNKKDRWKAKEEGNPAPADYFCHWCPPGKMEKEGGCVTCPDKTIGNGEGCAPCPTDKVCLEGEYRTCPEGQYVIQEGEWVGGCALCEAGYICEDGVRSPCSSAKFCEGEELCVGGVDVAPNVENFSGTKCTGETIGSCSSKEYWERESETCVLIPSHATLIDQTGYACNSPYWKNEDMPEGKKCVLCTCTGGKAKKGNACDGIKVDCATCDETRALYEDAGGRMCISTCKCTNGTLLQGSTCPYNGAQWCSTCSPGYFINEEVEGNKACIKCTTGTYSTTSDSTNCQSCTQCTAEGQEEDIACSTTQNRTCKCAQGYYETSTGTNPLVCTQCPPGYYCTGNGTRTKCPAGTYQTSARQSSCTKCADKTWSAEGRTTACHGCPPRFKHFGEYQNTQTFWCYENGPDKKFATPRGTELCSPTQTTGAWPVGAPRFKDFGGGHAFCQN
jgi:hypothetical protein